MKSFYTFFLGFFLILAIASCKAKHVVQKSEVSEIRVSTDSVAVEVEDNLFVACLSSGDFSDKKDTSTITADSIYNFSKAFSWLPRLLSSSPQVKKGGVFIIHSRKSSKSDVHSLSNEVEKSNSVIEQKKAEKKISFCHNVLFWVVLLIFICLVVRYRKKVSKIFGVLR